MNILVVGYSGRDHAIAQKCAESELVDRVFYWGPENGMSLIAKNVGTDLDDFEGISNFAAEKIGKEGLVIIGPEDPLAKGIVGYLEARGLTIFGPNDARIESSKYFCHLLLESYGIQMAPYRAFISREKAKEFIWQRYYLDDYPDGPGTNCVVKANGLMRGKGALMPKTPQEAFEAVDFLFANCREKLILVEDCLEGTEYSFTAVTDGPRMIPLAASRDYKREFNCDTGPNTGGQGCFAPALGFDDPLFKKMEKIAERVVFALWNEGIKYRGVLYTGFIVDRYGVPYILEVNARFGDPEAQVILPLMESDFVELALAAAKGDLRNVEVKWKDEARVCVVMSSPKAGYRIYGLGEASKMGVDIFHSRTRQDKKGDFFTGGEGRVLSVVGKGKTVKVARDSTYDGVHCISFHRKDHKHGKQTYREDIACNI